MSWRWRIVLGTLCVEVVAGAAVLRYGVLSLVAVAIIYWIDLAFVIGRSGIQQLLTGETTAIEPPRALPQFRLLGDKHGTVRLSDRLPPVYLRSFPTVLFGLSVLTASALSTAVVLAVAVPEQFWNDPATPFVLAAGAIAAATKSWLVSAGSGRGREPGFVAGKQQLVALVYAPVTYLVADVTTTALAQPELGETVLVTASVLIVLRVAYGVDASRRAPGSGDSGERLESIGSNDQPSSAAATPSEPDGQPLETVRPASRSVPAAGFVNALTTGGVVDGRFSDAGLHLRVYSGFVFITGTAAGVNGSALFQLVVACMLVSAAVFWLLSVVHMELAFGEIEYRFYESAVVAYDRRTEELQWSMSYGSIETVSVERGPFESPLGVDAGTVRVELADQAENDTASIPDERGPTPILFVPDPEGISDQVDARRGETRHG